MVPIEYDSNSVKSISRIRLIGDWRRFIMAATIRMIVGISETHTIQ